MIKVIINLILYTIFLNSGLENVFCNRRANVFFVSLFGIFTGKRILKNNSFIILALTVLLDYFIPKYAVKYFYHSSYKFSYDYHTLLIVGVILLIFCFISKETVKECDKSSIFFIIYVQLNSLFSSYKFFYYFTFIVQSHMVSQNRILKPLGQNDTNIQTFYFLVDFLIMNLGFTSRIIYKCLTSKTKKGAYLRALFNIFALFFFVNLFFYLNSSEGFLSICKEVNKLLPSYIGNTIYNSVSESPEIRFKYALIGLFSYFI
jgi:hypothetical protein